MTDYFNESLFHCCGDLEVTVGVEGLLYVVDAGDGDCIPFDELYDADTTPTEQITWLCLGFVTDFGVSETTNDIKIPCRYQPAHHWKRGRPDRTWNIGQLFTSYEHTAIGFRGRTVDFRLVINKNGTETIPGIPDCHAVMFVYNARIETWDWSMPETDEVTVSANGSYDRAAFHTTDMTEATPDLYAIVEEYEYCATPDPI